MGGGHNKKWKQCKTCNNKFFGRGKIYCSMKCFFTSGNTNSSDEYHRRKSAVLEQKREFYKKLPRYVDFKVTNRYKWNRPKGSVQLQSYARKTAYGVDTAWYESKLLLQDYKCAICGKRHMEDGKVLCIDHNHASNQVRGLLCHHCNAGIGFFRENEEYLLGAIGYLKSH